MATDQRRGQAADPTPDLPDGVIEDLLASQRRQHVLSCLETRGDTVLADLAAAVAAREADTDPARVDDETRREVREAIYADHLPKLTATGVVAFDSLTGTVSLRADGLTDR